MSAFTDAAQKVQNDKDQTVVVENIEKKSKNATNSLAETLKKRKEGSPKKGFKFKGLGNSKSQKEAPSDTEPNQDSVSSVESEEPKPVAKKTPPTRGFVHPEQSDKYTEEEVERIQTSISILYENMEDKEIVAQAMRAVLTDIRKNQNLRELIKPEDCGMMVRHLREEYGVEVIKKAGKAKAKTESIQRQDDIMQELGDFF